MHIALCGPCSPSHLADLLDDQDAERARAYSGIGGQPVADLARGLREAGHRVSVVTMTASPTAEEETFHGDGLAVFSASSEHSRRSRLDGYRREANVMAGALRQMNADLVHAHWTYEFESAAQHSRLLHVTTAHDCPVSVFRHMPDRHRLVRLQQALRVRPGIAHLSAVSPYTAQSWRRLMAYRRSIEVIPNSIPDDVSHLTRRPASTPTVLDIADGTRGKNSTGLIRAFQIVRAREPSAVLRLAGPDLGPTDPIAKWAGRVGMTEGVTFLGPLDRTGIGQELSQAWVLAHASLEEACPMALLEALGSGVPVVGGERSGGVPYVLDHGRRGRLTDVRSPATFAKEILAALSDGPHSSVTASQIAHFHPTVVTAQYLSWYEQVLAGAEK